MGVAQSTSSSSSPSPSSSSKSTTGVVAKEGEHFVKIVTPSTLSASAKKRTSAIAKGGGPSAASASEALGAGGANPFGKSDGSINSSGGKAGLVKISLRAKILKTLSFELLWENFLASSATSFALTHSEISALLADAVVHPSQLPGSVESASSSSPPPPPIDPGLVQRDVASYLELIAELTEKEVVPSSKAVDFMTVCSSAMLLSSLPIEKKIDQLFMWIVLGDREAFSFDDLFVALVSFERGLSQSMGIAAASEGYIRAVATQWMTQADPQHRDCARDPSITISAKQFFDFCTNRQHTVRRLLEALGASDIEKDKGHELQEVVNNSDHLDKEPTGGDEFMANPAWKKTAEKMVPKGTIINASKPASYLTLDWVHGYRGFDCRNNIKYVNRNGSQLVFTAAALSIVQDNSAPTPEHRTQTYFGEHGDDIICMTAYEPPAGAPWTEAMIASGEIGKAPAIYLYVWKPNGKGGGQFQSMACMRGLHTKGVCQLAFSADGKRLFSVGVDYTIAVYNTEQGSSGFGKMVGSSQGPKDKILHASVCGAAGDEFVSCGEKHSCLWKLASGTPKSETMKCGEHKNKMFLSAVRGATGVAVLCTSEGDLITFKGIDMVPKGFAKEAHGKAPVNALWANPAGDVIISGGRDGKIIIWACTGETLAIRSQFRIEGFSRSVNIIDPAAIAKIPPPPLRSVCMSSDGKKIAAGTQSCEIIEFTNAAGLAFTDPSISGTVEIRSSSLVVGHFKDELWGLAVRPSIDGLPEDEYCTVGDDGFMRIWSTRRRCQLRCLDMQGMARCIAYSPDGQYIAVGFGGSVGRGKNKEDGKVVIFRNDENLSIMSEFQEAKQWISEIKFSPDGATLAVGSRDNSIYLYSVAQQYKRKAKFSKHSAGINQFDFSMDGKVLQSCCSAYEILFSDVTTGTQLTNGVSTLIDTNWATWTLTLGWCVNGIWTGDMDGTDINACDRSPSSRLVATSDDFGKVKVFRYPCVPEGSQASAYIGHSSHVTCVRWLNQFSNPKNKKEPTDDFLISTGGEDKCVFQWVNSGPEGAARIISVPAAITAELNASHGADDGHGGGEGGLDDAPTGGDEFTAVKAWLGAIKEPSAWTKPDPARAAQFSAALGEFSSQQRRLGSAETVGSKVSSEAVQAVYMDVERSAKNVFDRLSESGIRNDKAPDADELELEWVHGYRGFDCRNNLRYIVNGVKSGTRYVVYHAAALGILLDPSKKVQRYFKGHTDDIMSMAVFTPSDPSTPAIVATGQQAMGNTFVWEVPSMKTLSVIQTKQKSVNMLEFSKDGRLLVSLAEDKSIAISDWKSQNVIVNTKGDASVTFHMASSTLSGKFNFLSCGDKFIKYWTLDGRNLASNKVSTGECKGCGPQAFLCTTEAKGKFFVGCEDGFIAVISDGKKVKSRFDHNGSKSESERTKLGKAGGSVTSIYSDDTQHLLISGAKDGSVCVWNTSGLSADKDIPDLRCQFILAPTSASEASVPTVVVSDLMAKQIQSVCTIPNSPAYSGDLLLLISTRGCDVVEVVCPSSGNPSLFVTKSSKGRTLTDGVIVRSHCNDELWGMATHPYLPEYCTVGDDKTLRFFSVSSRSMMAAVPIGFIARAVSYHPSGQMIAVGFGGRVGKGKEGGDGMVRLYSCSPAKEPVAKLAEKTDAKGWISDVKFSSDGRTLAVGAHDCKIFIYNVVMEGATAKLSLRTTFGKHASVINHLDLSADGRFMQSNCSAFELLFSDTSTGKQITSATELKDVKWDSWTCTFGWPVQGIWPPGADGLDINGVCRSRSGHLVATSDDFGKVKVFRYPCITEGAQSLSYSGHSSHVTNVRWTAGDECLVSTGGNDKTVMQWRHVMADASGGGHAAKSHASADDDDESGAVDDVHGSGGGKDLGHGHAGGGVVGHADESSAFDAPTGGDESGCVKPWLGAVKPPKNSPPINLQAPAVNMQLAWVHGYTSGPKAGNNLFYNIEKDPVYPAAALGMKLHRDISQSAGELTQKNFKGHNDDILCLAISKDRRFVATGQTASKSSKGKGSICVWDAVECRLLCRMDSCHQRAVVSLAFSPEGNQLVSVGQDDKNTHTLWTDAGGGWSRAQQSATQNADQNPILFSRWVNPASPMCGAEYHFISGGAQVVHFWKLEGATLAKKAGRFGKKYKQCPLICAANVQTKDGWRIVCGTSTGDLYIFEEREVNNAVEKAHTGPVLSLAEGGLDCTFLVSGGKDKTIRVWNQALQPISSFELSPFSIVDASVGSIDVRPSAADSRSLTILAGTFGGEIIEISSESSGGNGPNMDLAGARARVLLYSHFSGELWGVATHPMDNDVIATVGDDSTLRLWSVKRNQMIGHTNLGWPARSVSFHPNGNLIAVGLMELTKGGLGGAAGGKKVPPSKGKGKEGGGGGDEGAAAGPGGSVLLYSMLRADGPDGAGFVLKKRSAGCPSVAWISEVKFSPTGQMLVAASHDKKLYAFNLPAMPAGEGSEDSAWSSDWVACLEKPKFAFNKHSSAVQHVDFSLDGLYMQTNCQAAELLFSETATGKQETSATKMAEYNGQLEEGNEARVWATQTCKLGWGVQGIWPPGADNSDINSTDKHVNGKLLATADDFGQVKVFRYPCVNESSKHVALDGHSSHVTGVRWTTANTLVSVGGNDKCLFVWSMEEK